MANAANLNQSSATAIDLLRQQIEAVLTAQGTASGTWVFVENVVAGSYNHYIWRCKGSGVTLNNSFGTDFYIALIYPTSAPVTLSIMAFETWDATAKTYTRPVSNGNQATNADTSTFSTSGLSMSGLPTSGAQGQITLPNSPNSFDSLIAVSKNALKVIVKRSESTTRYAHYIGLFQPIHPASNEFPLCIVCNANGFINNSSGDSSSTARFSRHPTRVSVAAATYNHSGVVTNWTTVSGTTSVVDALYGKAEASRVLLRMSGATNGSLPATYGDLRGLLYDVAYLTTPTSQDFGEKLTIDSKEHWGFPAGQGSTNQPSTPTIWLDSTAA